MNEIFSKIFLDLVGLTVYSTPTVPRGLLTRRAQPPSPQEDPWCLSPLRG
jgi:hypothetical protein